ncbi:MAG: tetratricopeptide repeat protein [Planctomycetota bacterium]|jgi:hypothetical protein
MKATGKLRQLFAQSDVAVGSKVDNRIISDALSAFDESTKTETTGLGPGIWRIIMKGKNAKLAAAAIVIITAALLITVLQDAATGPAYAIDQTVEAMSNVRFMHLVTRDKGGTVKDKRWIEIGMDGLQVRYRQENLSGFMVVEDGESTAVYHRDKQTVVIYDRKDKQYQWVGRLGDALENLRQKGKIIEADATYEGRAAHRVWWPMMIGECFVDPQTKLPIAIGRTELNYEQPPKGIFEITIPEGYAVVDKRPGAAPSEEPDWLKDDGTADVCFTQGRHALADGEYEKAAELLAYAAGKQPGRNWAWFWLGSANTRLYRFDAAIECYSKVLEMMEDAPYALYARGLAYGYRGLNDAAANDLAKALPRMMQSLREPSAAFIFEYADDPRLRDGGRRPSDDEVMIRMINRLRIVTGQDFGYDPDGTAEERTGAITAWEQWFENGGRANFDPNAKIALIPEVSE